MQTKIPAGIELAEEACAMDAINQQAIPDGCHGDSSTTSRATLSDRDARVAIRVRQVLAITGDSRSSYYARQNPHCGTFDPSYPRPFRLDASPRAPRLHWRHEIVAWLEARAELSRSAQDGGHDE